MKMTLEEAHERMESSHYGNLEVRSQEDITELPDNLVVRGNLEIGGSKIRKLPKNLTVEGDIFAGHTDITYLPKDLKANNGIDVSRTNISKLPDNFTSNGFLDLSHTKIESLPDNLIINGFLDISGTPMLKLPNNLIIADDFWLKYTQITSLPEEIIIGGDLELAYSYIKNLPDNLVIGGYISAVLCRLENLPSNLVVGKYLSIESGMQIPNDIKQGYSTILKREKDDTRGFASFDPKCNIPSPYCLQDGEYEKGRYLYADRVLTHVKSKRQKGKYTYYTGKIPGRNVIFDGKYYAHCGSFKQGVQDLEFKHAKNRGCEQYESLDLDDKVPFKDAIIMYRIITGACQQGTEIFLDSLTKKQEYYTPREIIELTENQYGNEVFKRFFES